MGRANGQKTRDKNKPPQTPAKVKKQPNANKVEYSAELADHEDLEAKARANAADQRVKKKKNKRK